MNKFSFISLFYPMAGQHPKEKEPQIVNVENEDEDMSSSMEALLVILFLIVFVGVPLCALIAVLFAAWTLLGPLIAAHPEAGLLLPGIVIMILLIWCTE